MYKFNIIKFILTLQANFRELFSLKTKTIIHYIGDKLFSFWNKKKHEKRI